MQVLSGQCYLADREALMQGLSGQCYLEDRGSTMQGQSGPGIVDAGPVGPVLP